MPTLYERCGKWRAMVMLNGKRKSATFATHDEAQEWANGIMTQEQRKRHRMRVMQVTGALSMMPPRVVEAMQRVTLMQTDIVERAIPIATCGIYFLLRDNEILYVGQSKTVFRRIERHREKGRNFDAFYFQPCRPDELNQLESDYIAALMPKWNMSLGRAA